MIVTFRTFLVLACGAFCITACNHNNGEVKQQGQHKDSAAHVVDTIAPMLAIYSQRITSNPNDANAYWNRGKLEEAQKNLKGALADLTKAVHIDSSQADYYYSLADVDFLMGQTRAAKDMFEKCVVLNPKQI